MFSVPFRLLSDSFTDMIEVTMFSDDRCTTRVVFRIIFSEQKSSESSDCSRLSLWKCNYHIKVISARTLLEHLLSGLSFCSV